MAQREYKAVIFDLFETLITEWGYKNIPKKKCVLTWGLKERNLIYTGMKRKKKDI